MYMVLVNLLIYTCIYGEMACSSLAMYCLITCNYKGGVRRLE